MQASSYRNYLLLKLMDIKIGSSVEKQWRVTYDMTAKAIKEGAAEVFSTPCMVSLMEDASCDVVAQFLDEGYISVGISVDIKHLKPTPIGKTISVKATIASVEGNKILLDVVCSGEQGIIGSGTHGRYIVCHNAFMANANIADKS